MKENIECKIVENLLPNYIDNLTDNDINIYIEKHIEKCPRCAQALADMNGGFKLEKINKDKHINYFKKLKRRVAIIITVVLLIAIATASGVTIYSNYKSQIQVNNYTFIKAEYIVENQKGTIDGNLYGTLMAVIDENGICKSARMVKKGYTEEAIEELNQTIRMEDTSNLKYVGDTVYCNTNTWNGWKKEEIIKYWMKCYPVKEIEEI